MYKLLFFFSLYVVTSIGCGQHQVVSRDNDSIAIRFDTFRNGEKDNNAPGEALLLSRYKSLDELKSVIQIKYLKDSSEVCLTQPCRFSEVTNVLKPGVDQNDFVKAANGTFWVQLCLGMRCPYAVLNKKALINIQNLGRRKPFVHGDVAFYDLAEAMVHNISEEDRVNMSEKDLSEKGYLNTFNHITASALMTSMYSESIADFIGDVHERTMPELMTGKFTTQQLADSDNGPVDNYLDLINNVWGQRLGKSLYQKYNINKRTSWTPELLASYLNDIESYHSWVFQIAFKPFMPEDEIVIRFAAKMNSMI